MRTPAAGKKRRLHVRRIIGVTLILLAVLIWNVPGQARAAGKATLISGVDLNTTLKAMVPERTEVVAYDRDDTFIRNIVWDKDKATQLGATNIATNDSDTAIYANYSNGTVHVYSDAETISLNPDSSKMFYGFKALEDVSGLFDHVNDASSTTTINWMFVFCKSLKTVDFSFFTTPVLSRADSLFDGCESLVRVDLSGLDLSNCTKNDRGNLGYATDLEEVVTPSAFGSWYSTLPGKFYVVNDDGSLGIHAFTSIPEGDLELSAVTLRRKQEDPTESPTPSSTPEVTASPTTEPTAIPTTAPTAVPTIRPTTAPTAVPTVTPTAVPTTTPVRTPTAVPTSTPTSTASASASPTRTPTSSARTSASPTPPVVTPVRSGTPRPTATSTVSATPAPTSNPSSTATPNGGSGNNNGGSATNAGNYSYYNPYAVVNNGRKGNAYDMPKTGDGDAFRLIAVAALFVTGCIVLISSVPSKKRN